MKKKGTDSMMIYKTGPFLSFTHLSIKVHLLTIFTELLYNNLIRYNNEE